MKRRDFIKKSTSVLAGASATALFSNAGLAAGKKVESMQLLTANAGFDPVFS